MKKTLLLTFFAVLAFGMNAQTVWNFGGDQVNFPISAGLANGVGNPATAVGGTRTVNGLTINTGLVSETSTSPCGVVSASSKTFTSPTTNEAYSFANRFLLNGSGYSGSANTDQSPLVFIPTARYLSFNVTGNCVIYMIGITGSSSSSRNMFVTNGTSLVGSVNFPAATALSEGTINYNGGATTLYVYGNASIALYYLSATNVVISSVKETFFSKGITISKSEIQNANNVELEVYNITGKKVTSSKENINLTNFSKGVYIVRIAGTGETQKFTI